MTSSSNNTTPARGAMASDTAHLVESDLREVSVAHTTLLGLFWQDRRTPPSQSEVISAVVAFDEALTRLRSSWAILDELLIPRQPHTVGWGVPIERTAEGLAAHFDEDALHFGVLSARTQAIGSAFPQVQRLTQFAQLRAVASLGHDLAERLAARVRDEDTGDDWRAPLGHRARASAEKTEEEKEGDAPR